MLSLLPMLWWLIFCRLKSATEFFLHTISLKVCMRFCKIAFEYGITVYEKYIALLSLNIAKPSEQAIS